MAAAEEDRYVSRHVGNQSDPFTVSAGEDIPVLLQQAPKSLSQGSATVLRGLLDPDLEGEFLISTSNEIFVFR